MSKVYVLIVNWNGWRDSLECVESVFKSDNDNYRVIVCDNGSQDDSMQNIKAWAENRAELAPVTYAAYQRHEAESGGDLDNDAPLVLIDCGANLGFAGGNNVGLRYALARSDCDYVWILNNDTVVRPDAMTHLVRRMQEKPDAGMCGSTLYYYDTPSRVQLTGGAYYCKWIGLPWHLGRLKRASDPLDRDRVERWMNYVSGASLFVSREFLLKVGLMCEEYFLFYEEADWALRGKNEFSLAYAPESIVYHKVGRSIGTSSHPQKKSYACDYYNVRNRLFFTSKFFPYALPTVYLVLIGTLLMRLLLGEWKKAVMISKLFFNYSHCIVREEL